MAINRELFYVGCDPTRDPVMKTHSSNKSLSVFASKSG